MEENEKQEARPRLTLQERTSKDLKTFGLHPFEGFPHPMNATLGNQAFKMQVKMQMTAGW